MQHEHDWEMNDDDSEYVPNAGEEDEDDDIEIEADYEDDAERLQEDLEDAVEAAANEAEDEDDLMGILRNAAALADLENSRASSERAQSQSPSSQSQPISSQSISVSLLQRLFSQPVRIIQSSGNRTVLTTADANEENEEEEEEDDQEDNFYYGWYGRPRRDQPKSWFEPVKEPQDTGVELIASGEFGRIAPKLNARNGVRNVAKMLTTRGTRVRRLYREQFTNELVPNTNGVVVASYDHNIYSGQFSADSTFYYTCCQDFRLHVYDTTAPPTTPIIPQYRRRRGIMDGSIDHQTTMKVIKTIDGNPGRWTITDSHLSPDNERIIYSSITPTVYLTTTLDSSTAQHPIQLADRTRAHSLWGYDESFGIYSCRFSADGNEVIAGGSGRIFVYDLLADRRTVKIQAHGDDVNSCCWADTASGNVLISASDDTFLKVWDRRSLGSSQKPSGVLIGHTEGITNVSAKGDGRYIISNGKDQALRLWDLRKMRTNAEYEAVANDNHGTPNFDYRYSHYPKPRVKAHPQDCSVMTYRGHSVMHTLIRCHFSPAETTGGQYIYSGSADGRIHIWSLDGRIVQVLNRGKTLPMNFDPSGPEPEPPAGERDNVTVRDVSWHSREPVLFSAGWESRHSISGSTVARHEWKGLLKAPGALEDWVAKRDAEKEEKQKKYKKTQRRVPGSFESEDDDEVV